MMREPARRAALALASATLVACSTDTSGLARRDPAGGAGGREDAAATAGAAGGGAGGGGAAGEEPGLPVLSGTGAISVVHGIIDGGVLFVCASDRSSGVSLFGGGSGSGDTAQPPDGLAYGGVLELPTDWDLSTADVEVNLFVAAGPAWTGASCAALAAQAVDPLVPVPGPDAGASDAGAVEAPFPLEPTQPRRAGSVRFTPGTLRSGARYGLIAAGCTGPGAARWPDACGEPDPAFGAQQAVIIAEISSEMVAGGDRLGLQFVNASRAIERADLFLQSDRQQGSSPLGNDVPFGAVRPLRAAAVAEPTGVELHLRRDSSPAYVQAWSDTLATRLSADGLLGHNHLLAYIGPPPAANVLGLQPPRFLLIQGR